MPAEPFSAGIPPLRKLGVLLFLLCLFALTLAGGTFYLLFHDLPLIQQAISETLAQTMKELQEGDRASLSLSLARAEAGSAAPFTLDGGLFYLSMAGLVVCWLMLVYRLAQNAETVKKGAMRASPLLCVLSFFLPVGNIWMPLQAMLDVNKALSFPGPSRGKGWIWLAWAVSVPGSLLIFLYTLFQPLFHFSETLRAWAEESPENVLALDRELEALLNGMVRPVIMYNGTALPGEPGKFRADDAPLLFPAKEAGQPPAFLISSLPPAKPRRKERKSRRTCSIPFLFLAGFLSASLPLSGTFTGKNRVALTGGFTKIFSRLPFPSGPFFLRGGIKPSGHKKPGLASRRAGPSKNSNFSDYRLADFTIMASLPIRPRR